MESRESHIKIWLIKNSTVVQITLAQLPDLFPPTEEVLLSRVHFLAPIMLSKFSERFVFFKIWAFMRGNLQLASTTGVAGNRTCCHLWFWRRFVLAVVSRLYSFHFCIQVIALKLFIRNEGKNNKLLLSSWAKQFILYWLFEYQQKD